MYSRKTASLTLEAIRTYYKRLEQTGYMRYDKVCELVALSLVNRFLNTELNLYVTEDDYRTMAEFLFLIIGRNCLASWPQFTKEIPQVGTVMSKQIVPMRRDSFGSLRSDCSGAVRTLEQLNGFWDPMLLRIVPLPPHSKVTINGEEKDAASFVQGTKVEWEVSADGYKSKSGKLRMTDNETLTVKLEKDGD